VDFIWIVTAASPWTQPSLKLQNIYEMVKSSNINIAVVGVGQIGLRHAQSVAKVANLLCLVDPIFPNRLAAEAFGVKMFSSIASMLEERYRPDGAVVATPNDSHVEASTELLEAGIHVLVEKPISTDAVSARSLINSASQSQAQLLVGHHRRFNPYVVATKDVLSKGIIGRPLAISALWMLCKPESYFETKWRASASGGPVLINMIHEVDLLQYMLGPIVRVHAEQTISQRNHVAEEGAAIVLRFQSGVVGTFLLSDATPSRHNFESATGENPIVPYSGADVYRIFGGEGTLSVGDMKLTAHESANEKSWSSRLVEQAVKVDALVPFDEQMTHFVRVIKGEEQPLCTGPDGLSALEVCMGIKKSLSEGQPVYISSTTKF
jgi:predicted dehydrogenase